MTVAGSRMNYLLFSEDYFETGRNAKEQQIIIGILAPNVVVLLFTDEGELHEVKKYTTGISNDGLPYEASGEIFCDLLMQVKSRFGFVPERISIQKFFLEEDSVGIQDFPDYLFDYRDNKNDMMYDLDTKRLYEELIAKWAMKNNFVFFWGTDYYIDGTTGEIESS